MLASGEPDKAYVTIKTYIKSDKMATKLAQIFEDAGLRELAIKIETHFEEKARERQYEVAVKARLDELREEMQRDIVVKPRGRTTLGTGTGISANRLGVQPTVIPFVQTVSVILMQSISATSRSSISKIESDRGDKM